jgi:hypothetical protein
MRKGIWVRLDPRDWERLEAVIGSGGSPLEARVPGSDRAAARGGGGTIATAKAGVSVTAR